MPQKDINYILKNGESFKLKKIDLSSRGAKKRFKAVRALQLLSKSRKIIDWERLAAFRISI